MKCVFGLLLLACCAAVGCDSPVVGASCRPGFAVCADGCVDLQADYRNCGECDNNCGQYLCKAGMCSSTPRPGADSGPSAGSDGGGVSRDAGVFDPDTGITDSCGLGSLECDGTCVDVTRDSKRCGACDHECGEREFCAYSRCFAECTGDLTFCGGQCTDVKSDPRHCGACGGVCASGICVAGSCEEQVSGRVVVIGHDFWDFNPAISRIAGNAVYLARGAPVRLLTYRGEPDAPSERGVNFSLEFISRELGRKYAEVEAVEALVPLQLNSADVFLIHAQGRASNSTLQKLGRQWANALAQFLTRGGTVVLFETPSQSNDGTYQILEPAHIFDAGGREEIASQQLRVPNTELGAVLRVPGRYMSSMHSVRFKDITTAVTPLVVDEDGEAVVLQRVIDGN